MFDIELLIGWTRITLSLFNTIVLLWLGLTVWLNAERRNLGVAAASGGFLLGGLFFVSHTALLFGEVYINTQVTALWLAIGMLPAVALPFIWYVCVLWFSGFWDNPGNRPPRQVVAFRSLLFLQLMGFIALGLLALPYTPILRQFATLFFPLRNLVRLEVAEIPIIMVLYPLYVLFCIVFSLDALRHPSPSTRMMGDFARVRAQPWLRGTSVALLCVGLGVAWVMMWLVNNAKVGVYFIMTQQLWLRLGRFDLVIMLFVTAATLMVGQAIVSYELFTGKALPRQGLRVYWRRVLFLAAGVSLAGATSTLANTLAIYNVLLTIILMTLFFALLGWRSYLERQNYIDNLRPFVASQSLYESVLEGATMAEVDIQQPFEALCKEVLNCERAHLVATGSLSSFVPNLHFPEQVSAELPPIQPLTERFSSPDKLYEPLVSAEKNPLRWAVPLWSDRGLIGILLIGNKKSGGLFSQEEIEIARTTGERLIDTQATAGVASRLMRLQRDNMAQTQIIDQQSRRVLHDEVLPLIQTAMIALSNGTDKQEAMALMTDAHKEISNLLHEMPATVSPDVARLGLLNALKRAVDAEFATAFDQIKWDLSEAACLAAEHLNLLAAETMFYAARESIRNSSKYARQPRQSLVLKISAEIANNPSAQLQLTIADNGAGMQPNPSRNGQGLSLHSTMMTVVGGGLVAQSSPQAGTEIALSIPIQPEAV